MMYHKCQKALIKKLSKTAEKKKQSGPSTKSLPKFFGLEQKREVKHMRRLELEEKSEHEK